MENIDLYLKICLILPSTMLNLAVNHPKFKLLCIHVRPHLIQTNFTVQSPKGTYSWPHSSYETKPFYKVYQEMQLWWGLTQLPSYRKSQAMVDFSSHFNQYHHRETRLPADSWRQLFSQSPLNEPALPQICLQYTDCALDTRALRIHQPHTYCRDMLESLETH